MYLRGICPEVFCKKGALRNFAKFTGKPVPEPLFYKSCWSQACKFTKKRLRHKCFPVNFAKFLGTPCFTENLRWLLLVFDKRLFSQKR